MEFCTSIHCIDGRIQEKIVNYLKEKYNIKYVDSITEPGPCHVLSENMDHNVVGFYINDKWEVEEELKLKMVP